MVVSAVAIETATTARRMLVFFKVLWLLIHVILLLLIEIEPGENHVSGRTRSEAPNQHDIYLVMREKRERAVMTYFSPHAPRRAVIICRESLWTAAGTKPSQYRTT
jgi:hypothetical protein